MVDVVERIKKCQWASQPREWSKGGLKNLNGCKKGHKKGIRKMFGMRCMRVAQIRGLQPTWDGKWIVIKFYVFQFI